MNFSHIHIGFKDLKGAVQWMERIWHTKPVYQNEGMAVFSFGESSLIFDSAKQDAVITIAFDSKNCNKDFEKISARGAEVLEQPTDQPWGVRVAYIKGPGETSFEIEEALK